MKIWIVCWVAEGNIPGCDVFSEKEKEKAFACLNYMMETGKTATIKTVNVQAAQPEEQGEAPEAGAMEAVEEEQE